LKVPLSCCHEEAPRSHPAPWDVYLLKRKAERLPFTVTARDSEEAIKRALEEHDIPERERFRVSVQRKA